MNREFTELFARTGFVKNAPVVRFSVSWGFDLLDLVSDSCLNAEALLRGLEWSPDDMYSETKGLQTYLTTFSGLTKFAIRRPPTGFAHRGQVVGWEWLDALKTHLNLRQVHVHVQAALSNDKLEGLGRACRNLEAVTVGMDKGLPGCIFDKTVFPNLKYFHDLTMPWNTNKIPSMDLHLQNIVGMNMRCRRKDGTLSDTLRVVCFSVQAKSGSFMQDGHAFLLRRDERSDTELAADSSPESWSYIKKLGAEEYASVMDSLGGHVDVL
ncbi:hypothetical protein ABW20_dc0108904 [Dactylellina cionopaga]|nr:hypothetical protein ABW20_dc0108904 [Dactylellina cionopaga]